MKGKNNIESTLNVITLGCSKNLVDSEKLLRQFEENGFKSSHNSSDYTDVVITLEQTADEKPEKHILEGQFETHLKASPTPDEAQQ